MDNNKIIIIVLIAIIAALLVGIFAMMPNMSKQDTKLTFMSNDTIDEGDSINIRLTDDNGTAIANQTVNVTVTDENSTSGYYSVVTDGNGTGKLKLDNDPGKYNITISYGGNDNFTGCNATQKITIKEKKEASVQSGPKPYAYKSDGTPMYSQQEVNDYMADKYGLVDYDIQENGYIDLKHGEPGTYSTNWKDGTPQSGLR